MTYNYYEQSYTGSKTYTWTLKAPSTAGTYKLYSMIYHGSSLYVKTYTTGLTITVQATQVANPTVSITAPASGSTISGTATVTANAVPASGATISSCELRVDGSLIGTDTASPYSWSLNTASYSNGQHTLNVTTTDNGGRKGYAQISVTVSNVANPTVTMTSPASGATVGGTITITGSATAASGASISSVELKVDGTVIGTDTSSPYSWTLNTKSYSKGAHTLNLTATDNSARKGYAQISVTFNNDPPVVSFSSPASGAVVSGTMSVSATSTTYAGRTTASVQLRIDSGSIGTLTASPYTWSINTNTLSNGAHTLNVTSTDSLGYVGYAQRSITVNNPAPVVSITSPSNGAQVKGTVTVTVSATSSSTISYVALYLDSTSLGNKTASPYTFTLNTLSYADGQHNLRAVSGDQYGRIGEIQITVTVNNTGGAAAVPVVSISAPSNGATLSGTVTVTASVTSSKTISSVSVRLDGTVVFTKTASPYSWSLSTGSYADGAHVLNVTATDSAGKIGYQQMTVYFSNAAPAVSISSIAPGQTLFGKAWVNATATASSNIASIEVLVDGTQVYTSASSPIAWQLDTNKLIDGKHFVNVTATDINGKIGLDSRSIVVDNSAPAITITSPSVGSVLFGIVQIKADVVATHALRYVSLMANDVVMTNTSAFNGTFVLGTTALADGQSTLRIVAGDTNGKLGSATLSVVIMNQAPAFTVEGIAGNLAGRVNVTAVFAGAGAAKSVSFSVDGTALGTVLVAPYTIQLDTVALAEGTHTLSVSALGTNGVFANQSLTINISNPAPLVSVIGVPVDGNPVSGAIDLVANVTAPYPLLYVNLTVDGMESGNTTSAPYIMTLDTTNLQNGEHTLNVTAVGMGGKSATTSFALRVFNAPPPIKIELSSVDLLVLYTLIIISALGIAIKWKKK
jgi:large repetitive protein